MTIEEAIEHCEEKACINTECAHQHLQLAEWLKELKRLRLLQHNMQDAFIEKARKWLDENSDKYIWYSDYAENDGDETCGMNDDFVEDFCKAMKK